MRNLHLLIITIVSLVLGWQLLRIGYYPMHDDLQVMRLYEMRRCFDDGQIPCRWAPDMDNGYGQPMFNYYSVFPYYIGTIFNLIGFQFVDAAKILFLLSIIVSGIGIYALTVQLLTPLAALLASIAFLTAPYHALDIFVRGAMSEIWGFSLLPLLLSAVIYLTRKPSVNRAILVGISLFAMITSHNIVTLVSTPLLIVFTLVCLYFSAEKKRTILFGLLGVLLGIGLSAFFILPAVFEQNLIQTQGLTSYYFDFHAHFATIKQLFYNFAWGYGPSEFGPNDKVSFFVGVVHVASILVAPLSLFFAFKKSHKLGLFTSLFFCLALFSAFLTHNKSTVIWDSFPVMAYVQFPWRFLGLTMLGTSFLVGVVADLISNKLRLSFVVLVGLSLIAFNFSYFQFEKWFYWINDDQKLHGELYNLQIRAAVTDYLPNASKLQPYKDTDKAPTLPQVISGRVNVNYFDNRSQYFASEFDVYSEEAIIRFPVIYFPNWVVYQDRSITPHPFTTDNDFGQITVKLAKGHHLIQGFLGDTQIRSVANGITVVTLLAILLLLQLNRKKNED